MKLNTTLRPRRGVTESDRRTQQAQPEDVSRHEVIVLSARGRQLREDPAPARRNDKHPWRPGDGSDQVGRNYMFHNSSAVVALSRHKRTPRDFQKTLSVNDYYLTGGDDFPLSAREHPDDRQIEGPDVPGRTDAPPTLRARPWSLDYDGPSRGRLLADDGRPAAITENRISLHQGRAASSSRYTPNNPGPKRDQP